MKYSLKSEHLRTLWLLHSDPDMIVRYDLTLLTHEQECTLYFLNLWHLFFTLFLYIFHYFEVTLVTRSCSLIQCGGNICGASEWSPTRATNGTKNKRRGFQRGRGHSTCTYVSIHQDRGETLCNMKLFTSTGWRHPHPPIHPPCLSHSLSQLHSMRKWNKERWGKEKRQRETKRKRKSDPGQKWLKVLKVLHKGVSMHYRNIVTYAIFEI